MDSVISQKAKVLEKWMPGRNRVHKMTLWTPPLFVPPFYSQHRVIGAFHNSGKHVYWSPCWPTKGKIKTFKILWFAKFKWWACLHSNVWVRHVGHCWYKKPNGDANVVILVQCNGIVWRLKIRPQQTVYVVEYYPFQAVYKIFKRFGELDPKLLSHG